MTRLRQSIVSVLCIITLFSMLLTACGGQQNSTESTTAAGTASTTTTVAESTEASLPEVKLTWYLLSNPQPDDNLVYAEANKYIKEKINATVDIIPMNMGEYQDKINIKLASGDPIDIVFTSSWLNPYMDMISKGALLPLDELIDSYAKELKVEIPQNFWDLCKVKKTGDTVARLWGIPNYQIAGTANGLAFKKELVDKYNLGDAIKNAKTMDDLTPVFDVIKKNEPDIYPLVNGIIGPYFDISGTYDPTWTFLDNNPCGIDRATWQVKDAYEFYDNKEVQRVSHEWYKKGYVNKDAVVIKDLEPFKKKGNVFCTILGAVKPGVEQEFKNSYGYDIVVKDCYKPEISIGNVTATMNAIPVSSENPERAMMLFNLVNTDKYLYNLMNFGIENTHYKKIDANTIELVADSKFNPQMAWALGDQFNAYVTKGQPADIWEKTKELNERAEPSWIDPFAFNPEPVKTELAQFQAIFSKYRDILAAGAADPEETHTKIMKELAKNDLFNKIRDEVQKQVDQFRADYGK